MITLMMWDVVVIESGGGVVMMVLRSDAVNNKKTQANEQLKDFQKFK